MKDENLNSQEKQFLSKSARALSKKLKAPYETIYQVLVENYEKIDTSLYSSRVIGVGKRHYESFPADEHFESTWVEELDKELSFEYESPLSAVSYIKDSKEPDVLIVKQNALNVLYGETYRSSKHEDRVYRIGQTKDVHVYYPMAVHPVLDYSFDETLDELLQQKKHLADSTIYPIDKLEITAEDFAKQMFT